MKPAGEGLVALGDPGAGMKGLLGTVPVFSPFTRAGSAQPAVHHWTDLGHQRWTSFSLVGYAESHDSCQKMHTWLLPPLLQDCGPLVDSQILSAFPLTPDGCCSPDCYTMSSLCYLLHRPTVLLGSPAAPFCSLGTGTSHSCVNSPLFGTTVPAGWGG